jgi:amino-acid N-acetyltransferase
MSVILRPGRPGDTLAIHELVTSNLEAGHLLPRSVDEIQEHITRFVVAEAEGRVVGCAELARLSPSVAEVRSLVVEESLRGQKIGTKLVAQLATSATVAGYATLCAFTHDPAHFVRLGFTIVPHIWVPEKIAHDCTSCVFFRRCGQYAVRLPLRPGIGAVPERTVAMGHARGVAPRRPNIERLHLVPCRQEPERHSNSKEAEPVEALHA